jgi:hypothetical protein
MALAKPGEQQTTTNRNKRINRYNPRTNNDTDYRLATPSVNNRNKNRFS